ncbi:MAG: VWA domain-containing protein [Bacillota bacterium]|nr:VWA domain-containing protein [Bacillota bacterium]
MKMNLTEIVFLLDRSGSMGGFESDTIGGFNAFIEKQKQAEGDTIVTVALFDDKYEILWNGIDINKARLTGKEYYVRGCTALLDAVGKSIFDVGSRLSMSSEEERPGKVIFVITTDGLENASREFTYEKVKELIKHQQDKYKWDFIFLGANIDAAKEADSIGIAMENAHNFSASKAGIDSMYCLASNVVSEKRKGTKKNGKK